MNCSRVGHFHGVQSFRRRLIQHGFSTESQVLPGNLIQCGLLSPWVRRSCQEIASAWTSHGFTASFGCIYLLQRGVCHGLQVDISSTVGLHGCRGTACLIHGAQHGLQENVCSGTWSISSLSFSLALVPAELFLPHILTHLSCCNCGYTGFFFSSS